MGSIRGCLWVTIIYIKHSKADRKTKLLVERWGNCLVGVNGTGGKFHTMIDCGSANL